MLYSEDLSGERLTTNERCIFMKTYVFNDKRGSRDRKCFYCVIHAGEVFSMKEAEDSNLAVFRSLSYEKNGKWSNSTWEVTLNSASLVVFMEPFDGWSERIHDVVLELKESCQRYIGYEPTDTEAVLAFQYCCPWQYERRMEKQNKLSNLL
jgi:hypothetical protein